MSILLKTRKKLWGASGSFCAFENCRKPLFVENRDTVGFTTIGDEAHIISGQVNGPRYVSSYPEEKINSVENLVLLCKEHHAIVDSDVEHYTIQVLRHIKNIHEKWVREKLTTQFSKIEEDELLAEYIDEIELKSDFNSWDEWTSRLRPSFPRIEKKQLENLISLHKYLRGRIYPNPDRRLVKAIQIFCAVLEDFIYEFEPMCEDSRFEKGYSEIPQLYKLGNFC